MPNWNSTKTQSDNRVKKLFFLVAMPRSGNTLFTSIMNQNPNIACTPNSITLEIMKDLFLLKGTDVFQNYPHVDHIHYYGFYIGNFPSLEPQKIVQLCKILNSVY